MRAINRLVFINLFIYEAVFQQSFEKLDFKQDFPFGESKTQDRIEQEPEDVFKTFFPKKKTFDAKQRVVFFPGRFMAVFFFIYIYKQSTLSKRPKICKIKQGFAGVLCPQKSEALRVASEFSDYLQSFCCDLEQNVPMPAMGFEPTPPKRLVP